MNDTVLYVLLAAGLFFLGLYGKFIRIRNNQHKPKKKRKRKKTEDGREDDGQTQ